MDWNNKRILIVGKGVSGRAAYERLSRLGALPVFYDDSNHEDDGAQYTYAQVEGATWDCAVLSPGVRPEHPILGVLARLGVPTMSEPDLAYLLFHGRIVAVTGTNGKTTTVRLVESMLRAAGIRAMAVGNIGQPLCAVRESLDVAVVEMSSFQCHQSVLFAPDVATITNIAPDHLEWHGSMEHYRHAKESLLRRAHAYALNLDDPDLPRVDNTPCFAYSLTDTTATVFVDKRIVWVRVGRDVHRVASVENLPLSGNHNLYNVMCALSLSVAVLGYRPAYAEAVMAYRGERMRTEQITFCRPYVFNDSKGTNTAATAAAMRQMVGTTALLLGGYDKGEDYARLMWQLPETTHIVTFGAAGERICRAAREYGFADAEYYPQLEPAVQRACLLDVDNILFSPSCSSFDAYTSYVARGEHFEDLIRRYL